MTHASAMTVPELLDTLLEKLAEYRQAGSAGISFSVITDYDDVVTVGDTVDELVRRTNQIPLKTLLAASHAGD